jgi:hypothetical protein
LRSLLLHFCPTSIRNAALYVPPLLLSEPHTLTWKLKFILFTNALGGVGYILLLSVNNNSVKYFATFVCTIAVYNGTGLNLAWLNVNMAPQYRRATAIGIQQTIGNSAGIVAGQVYRQSPYILGHGFSLGCIGVANILVTIHLFYLLRLNKEKRAIIAGEREDTRKKTTGDRDLEFTYRP